MRSAPAPARNDAGGIQHVQCIVYHTGNKRTELTIAFAQGCGCLLFGCDMSSRYVDQSAIGSHRPGNPAPTAVAMTESVLHAHRRHALSQLCSAGDGPRGIIRMPKFVSVKGFDLVLSPAE